MRNVNTNDMASITGGFLGGGTAKVNTSGTLTLTSAGRGQLQTGPSITA